jgi:small subunit ribosomal protein S6
MQQYETVIILTPLLSEEAVKEVLTKFNKLMKTIGV